MMGKTHIFVGIASALAITSPDNIQECLPAIVGGALGGSISDIDVNSKKRSSNNLYAKLIASGIVPISLVIDLIADGGMIDYVKGCNTKILIMGLILFIALCFIGSKQDHRGFTHSLLALALFSVSVGLFCKPILFPFAVGFMSHILLDVFNKKPVKLFFPLKKGVYLDLFYANKTADKVSMFVAIVAIILLLGHALTATINISSIL
ncbi:MAG: metal-dependent hydrolase [Acutalibacteraceae bacterium]|nr:metal-dependent hydrolase [Acutalibacteraceae bacterium]